MTLASVLAAPEDMDVRRAYADEIRARDPDRARLIDQQLAVRDARRRGSEPAALPSRAAIKTLGARWAGDLAPLVQRYDYWGGFVEDVRVGAAQIGNLVRLVQLAPIRFATITGLAGVAPVLPIAQLVGLDIGDNDLGDAAVAALAAQPNARGLRYLRIAGNPCGPAAMRALAKLPALRFVDATGTQAPLVVKSSDWDGSAEDVAFTAIHDDLVAELGHLPWLDALIEPSFDVV